ncbi:MAG: GFA family protein [Polyangiaceae bacterium]|nr:GFA family protein [Polyangiaceae bacterium]
MSGLSGACLCGAVSFACSAEPMVVGHCYCVDCRKSSGTSHCTHVAVPEAAVELSGTLRFYERAANSGNLVSRGFCPECGSAVLSRNSGQPGFLFIRASSLDDLDAVTPSMSVYVSRAPRWAKLDREGPLFDEMPPGGPPLP